MKFLIFGGSGFVGKKLTAFLIERGLEVKTVSRSALSEGFAVDITVFADFEKIDFIPDVIINCASRIPEKEKTSQDPEFVQELFHTNVVGGLNIAKWAVAMEVPKIVNCSTLVVVKKPWPVPLKEDHYKIPEGSHVAYSMSKLSQEQLMNEAVKDRNTKLLHARLSAVYGEDMVHEGILFQLLNKLILNETIELVDSKKNSIDLIHVEDAVKALHQLALAQTSDEMIFNVGSGSPVSVYELANRLKIMIGSDSEILDRESPRKASEALISIDKLKAYTNLSSESFIPLNKGLEALVSKYEQNFKSSSL